MDNMDTLEQEVVKMMLSTDDVFDTEPYIFIEIAKNSHIKYEYDKQKNALHRPERKMRQNAVMTCISYNYVSSSLK